MHKRGERRDGAVVGAAADGEDVCVGGKDLADEEILVEVAVLLVAQADDVHVVFVAVELGKLVVYVCFELADRRHNRHDRQELVREALLSLGL